MFAGGAENCTWPIRASRRGSPAGRPAGDTTPVVCRKAGHGCQARRVSSRRRVVVPVLVAAALLLAACGTDDDSHPAAATSAAATSSSDGAGSTEGTEAPQDDDADASSFPSDVGPAEQAASADSLVTVTDIRTGEHDGYDRVVFEVDGEGTPGWDVRYVDEPTEQASGKAVEVAGAAALQVLVTGAGYPYDTGVAEYSGGPVAGAGTQVVTEVVFRATFEGATQAFIGTTGESPFRVYLLDGPTRIVVEVAHPG